MDHRSRPLCPWDFPGKNTGVDCHFLIQGIFPTQGSNHSSWIGRRILYSELSEKPNYKLPATKTTTVIFHHLVLHIHNVTILSVQFSHSVGSDCLRPHELQHASPPCPSPTPGVNPNSCPLSRWCHPTVSSSVVPFSSRLQSFPASGSFLLNLLFASGGQSIGVSASTSVLPMNTQDCSPLGWTSWISLQSKGLPRVFSNTKVQKHKFFGAQLSLQSNSHIHTWPLEKP